TSPQQAEIRLDTGQEVLNFCANNYLGLSNHPELKKAAAEALETHGYGMSSVRFICGTTDLHKKLEKKIADFMGTEDTILYAAAFDANGGVFEPLFTAEDAIISDSLNHASIIDGVRLCKAKRYRYPNADMAALEEALKEAQALKKKLFTTAEQAYAESGKVDIITGTLGKAFGGAVGGFTTGRKEIIDMLRQRSRPYLFSNSLPPIVVNAGIRMFDMMRETNELQDKLHDNTDYFMKKMLEAGFDIKPTQSAICAVMLYDAKLSQDMAAKLLEEGIYVIGFYYPVVPKGEARIRVQLSAGHERKHLDKAIAAFKKVGRELDVIK
ncbi:MAG: aminotransferase class I/II-fold pyridoxal phosphate-dependent enzyme, partial [bacterium]